MAGSHFGRYAVSATDRYISERPSSGTQPDRSEFARDRARVLHSAALRRLAAKTQVETAGEEDFPRTRLTHSLEVAQIGRELGSALGCDPDVVDAAGLAHDLGHPPFGHNGEDMLHELAQPCGGFEGNAQTLRVLTRLEPKVLHHDGRSAGLNLTRAVLDAATKYPWPYSPQQGRKFGVYADDTEVFDWLRADAPGRRRCLEAQVMNWADDVAYSVHDVEDGVHAGHVQLRELDDSGEREALCAQVATSGQVDGIDRCREVLGELLALPALRAVADYNGSHRSQAAMKQATSALVGRLVHGVVSATVRRHGSSVSRYDADLVVPERLRVECGLLKGIAMRYVMARPGSLARHRRQQDQLAHLVMLVQRQAPECLDAIFRPWWEQAGDDAVRLRVVIDQVASLTDRSVLTWCARLDPKPTLVY